MAPVAAFTTDSVKPPTLMTRPDTTACKAEGKGRVRRREEGPAHQGLLLPHLVVGLQSQELDDSGKGLVRACPVHYLVSFCFAAEDSMLERPAFTDAWDPGLIALEYPVQDLAGALPHHVQLLTELLEDGIHDAQDERRIHEGGHSFVPRK